MKIIKHDTALPGRAFNPELSECEVDILTTDILFLCLIIFLKICTYSYSNVWNINSVLKH